MTRAAGGVASDAPVKHWCETCEGLGTIDETLGGEHFSNPKAPCPDCDGQGWWTPRATPGVAGTFNDPDRMRAWEEAGRRIQAEDDGIAGVALPREGQQ